MSFISKQKKIQEKSKYLSCSNQECESTFEEPTAVTKDGKMLCVVCAYIHTNGTAEK